jgi:integrating conjugative element protein (TIGR03759 family)
MKPAALAACLLVVALAALLPSGRAAPPAAVAQSTQSDSRIQQSEPRPSRDAVLEELLARSWGLQGQEWARYRQLMRGPLGIYSPNLDPLTALGIEAQTSDERSHYAELQVRMEARRVEKILAYQRAYDAAWKRTYPTLRPVESAGASSPNTPRAPLPEGNDGRIAVFVKENCILCEERVKRLQAAGRAFDLYLVGSRHEDARIRGWAAQVGIDPNKVRARQITLNHDEGRWLSIGGHGELPAVLRLVDGQWQRE